MKIFVIEGTDGSGKQTQTKMLVEKLAASGENVILQSFPNYDSLSSGPVKMYLGGELSENANGVDAYQSSALFAIDRFCTLKKMENSINENTIIVFDRYVSSNMIHQASKIENKREKLKYLKWLNKLEFGTLKLPKPTKIIFLDMPPEKSIELAHSRGELKAGTRQDIHEKDSSHLINAYKNGKFISKLFKWSEIKCVNELGEIKTREEISNEIWNALFK